MRDILIILPIFNDWQSLNKVLNELNASFKKNSYKGDILIIDDGSTEKRSFDFKKKLYFKIFLKKLNKNVGSQRAIFLALQDKKIKKYSTILIMDSDGEDDTGKVPKLLKLSKNNPDKVIIATRKKRREKFFLKILNYFRLMINYIFVGNFINFGNFSCFNSSLLSDICKNNNAWFAFSSALKKNSKNLLFYPIEKKIRYYGEPKASYFFLVSHAINILTVFKEIIFYRSIFFIFIFIIFKFNLIFFFLLFLFNFLILFNYNRNLSDLKKLRVKIYNSQC